MTVAVQLPASTLQTGINYSYDNLGQESSEQWMNGSSVAKTISFAYDLDGNLLSATDNTAGSLIPGFNGSAPAISGRGTHGYDPRIPASATFGPKPLSRGSSKGASPRRRSCKSRRHYSR